MSGGKKKICLVLGSHAHVPAGAAEYEFENAYEKILRPFISTLCRYPKIQALLHYSGALLYWVERSHPELFMLIEDMVSRKQAELLGGGFYEPMLPLISPQDRIGQIEFLTTYLRRHFGKRPLGCWIPALAWEQHLVGSLAASGMSYTFLGENQFLRAGLAPEELFAPCISEDQGKLITVFPILRSVEAALAAKSVSLVLDELESRLQRDGERGDPPGAEHGASPRIVSIFPERLVSSAGEAPDYTWNRFFEELSLAESLIECVTPGKLLKGCRGLKKMSFPDSAGGDRITPRRFLIEHPEANGIYAKMIFTNVLISQLRGDKSRKQSAREELWKAQDCDLFYLPENGGPCRHSLRKAAYRSLIGAERITREKGKFSPSLAQFDFDFDGEAEYLFQDLKLNCYIQPLGAGVFELDYLPRAWNYLDAGFDGESGREPRRRTAFADYLLPEDAGVEVLLGEVPPPEGVRRCCAEKYEADLDRSKGKALFTLSAKQTAAAFGDIEITKCFALKKDTLAARYSIANRGKESRRFRFVCEINLSFAGEGDEFVRFFACKTGLKDIPVHAVSGDADSFRDGTGRINGAEGLKMQDLKNEAQINLVSSKPFDGCLGAARIGGQYRSSRVMPLFEIALESGETWSNEFGLKFSH
jgi:hypothetical protein